MALKSILEIPDDYGDKRCCRDWLRDGSEGAYWHHPACPQFCQKYELPLLAERWHRLMMAHLDRLDIAKDELAT